MNPILRFTLTWTALGISVVAAASAQDPVVFRTTAELVRLRAVVFASDGGPVMDLSREDFTVIEDGEERPISVFMAPSDGPMEIVLAIDTSGSMSRWPTRQGALVLLEALNPRSCVLVLPFDRKVRSGIWGHPGDPAVREFITKLLIGGSTAIYDPLLAAFRLLRRRRHPDVGPVVPSPQPRENGLDTLRRYRTPRAPQDVDLPAVAGECTIPFNPWAGAAERANVRRAVVVLTDGQDGESKAGLDDVLLAAWGSRIPIFALAILPLPSGGPIGGGVGRPPQTRLLSGMAALAAHSGGLVIRAGGYRPGSDRAFLQDVHRLESALRGHYTLGYVPAKAGPDNPVLESRSIEVTVSRPNVDVLTSEELVLGRGRSEGAAFQISLDGFAEFTAGRAEEALEHFTTAASLAPKLGMARYGRGLALMALGRHAEATGALERAAELAPWIPDIEAHLAEMYLDAGRIDLAWEHAVRAYDNGSEVLPLIDRLQLVAPRPFDPDRLPTHPNIALEVGGSSDLLGAVVLPPLLAALAAALDNSDTVSFGMGGKRVVTLRVDVTKAKERFRKIELQGWLTLERSGGKKIADMKFKLEDAESAKELEAAAAEFVRFVERALADR